MSHEKLKFHPLADIFPLMEGAEFDALVADIKANGVQSKIVLYQGKILDGRNRYRAILALKYNDEFIKAECKPLHEILGYAQARDLPKDEALKWVISANIHRRHLTAEQKRDLIAKLIKAQPEKSDRAIAATAKVSPTTVGAVRSTVQSGQLPEKRVGKDGKARKQPAKKIKPKQAPEASDEMAAAKEPRKLAKRRLEEQETDRLCREGADRVAAILIARLGRDSVAVVYQAMLVTGVWLPDAIGRQIRDTHEAVFRSFGDLEDFVTKFGKLEPRRAPKAVAS